MKSATSPTRRADLAFGALVALSLATVTLAGCGASEAGNLLAGELIPGTPTGAPAATSAPPTPP